MSRQYIETRTCNFCGHVESSNSIDLYKRFATLEWHENCPSLFIFSNVLSQRADICEKCLKEILKLRKCKQ